MIDWNWDAISNIVTAFAALGAMVTAILGLRTWRSEMVGRRRAELAEEVLANFYQAEEAIRFARNPIGFSGEADDRSKREDESLMLQSQLNSYFVPVKRLNDEGAFFSQFFAKRHRFAAVFGTNAAKPFQEFREIRASIRTASSRLSAIAQRNEGKEYSRADEAWLDRDLPVLYEQDENDPIPMRAAAAVRAIEQVCRPAILE